MANMCVVTIEVNIEIVTILYIDLKMILNLALCGAAN